MITISRKSSMLFVGLPQNIFKVVSNSIFLFFFHLPHFSHYHITIFWSCTPRTIAESFFRANSIFILCLLHIRLNHLVDYFKVCELSEKTMYIIIIILTGLHGGGGCGDLNDLFYPGVGHPPQPQCESISQNSG